MYINVYVGVVVFGPVSLICVVCEWVHRHACSMYRLVAFSSLSSVLLVLCERGEGGCLLI